MGLLDRLFGRRVHLDPALSGRLDAWSGRPEADLSEDFDATRYVVVDVETTGLDLARDRLIAIGACAVENGEVVMADSFEIVLRQDRISTKDNILIHGIGGEAQREGLEPAEALLRFLDFLGKSPLVAFHVTFDQTMIKRAVKEYLGFDFKHPWLDLAYVMPGLLPQFAQRYRALDDWSNYFEISNFARHSALADALATAQLFLCALPLARDKQSSCYRNLQDLEKAQRWINWTG
ncbi:MAG: exonuclease [bacterium]|jgi:DNA polymerase-3 subunit epsilon|nr:MAG: exonuclease [bacterium]KAF0150275.1 MAG: exonuclease [bacterium]KAF0169755.1 MAG: exonuclease [bacterium]TXT19386.1 MAG: exonuclease [bacterium]